MSESRLSQWASRHRFAPISSRGFLAFERTLPDGVRQQVALFRWGNREVADWAGAPRSYLVAVITRAVPASIPPGRHFEDASMPRVRIPLVEWPSESQPGRPWREVADELDQVVLPLLEATDAEVEQLVQHLREGGRNALT